MPNSTVINGKGRYAGGPAAPLSVVNVSAGQRYRFRLGEGIHLLRSVLGLPVVHQCPFLV